MLVPVFSSTVDLVYDSWQRSNERQWSLTQAQEALSTHSEPPLFTILQSETFPLSLLLPIPNAAADPREVIYQVV